MKIFIPLVIIVLIIESCGSSDPRTLANAYCDCIKKATEESDYQTCQNMAKEHKSQLGDNQDQLQKYSDELVNCTNVSK